MRLVKGMSEEGGKERRQEEREREKEGGGREEHGAVGVTIGMLKAVSYLCLLERRIRLGEQGTSLTPSYPFSLSLSLSLSL